ncbi:MAG: SAM-dependent methyltransferase, partial [Cyanobacteria bacterium J06639_18]
NPLFVPGLWVFFWLFETETAWKLLRSDLPGLLRDVGFKVEEPKLYAGGSLQVIQARK